MLDYIPPRVLWLKILRVNDFFFFLSFPFLESELRHFLEFFFLRKVYLRIEVSRSRFC